jgi:peptidoglycan hydrolase-like protein with peptidoglycan-binding domain
MPATIGPGSSGNDVKRLQRVLARMLLWNPFGPINGVFDASLEDSVKSFQQNNGLPVGGIVGPATWAKLPSYRKASPTLRNGSTGRRVASAGVERCGHRNSIPALHGSGRRYLWRGDRKCGQRVAGLGRCRYYRHRRRQHLVHLDDAGICSATHARSCLRTAAKSTLSQNFMDSRCFCWFQIEVLKGA